MGITLKKFIKAFIPYGILKIYWNKKEKSQLKKITPAYIHNYFVNNPYESEVFIQSVYSLFIKEKDYVIDVGANHGFHTIPLSKLVGKQGKVFACEAVSSNIEDIKTKLDVDNIYFFVRRLRNLKLQIIKVG